MNDRKLFETQYHTPTHNKILPNISGNYSSAKPNMYLPFTNSDQKSSNHEFNKNLNSSRRKDKNKKHNQSFEKNNGDLLCFEEPKIIPLIMNNNRQQMDTLANIEFSRNIYSGTGQIIQPYSSERSSGSPIPQQNEKAL